MRSTAALVVVTLAIGTLLAGCSSNSLEPDDQTGPQFLLRTAPGNAIHNIALSYVEMNAEEYLDCLSADFVFYPTEGDVQDPDMNIPPEWYKTDEQDLHENMFGGGSDIESVSLTLTMTDTVYVEGVPGDESDDTYIYKVSVDLRVNVQGGLTYLATTPSEYYVRVDQDQTGPGRQTLWEIYMWYDLGHEDCLGEDKTWGAIKAIYMLQPTFLRRTSPENVIDNIATAYVWKNAEEYLDCLSDDFVFYPDERDVQDPDLNIPPEWYKIDEMGMHNNMFSEGSDVESISLTLTNSSIQHIPGNPEDPADDVYIYTEAVDLRLNVYGGLTYLATTPSEYHIRVDQDEQGPAGETLWDVYEWYDLGDEWSRVEGASWGGIKALYR